MLPRFLVLAVALVLGAPMAPRADEACLQDVVTLAELQARNHDAALSVLAHYGEAAVPARYKRVLVRLVSKMAQPGQAWALHGYQSAEFNAMSGLDGSLLLATRLWRSRAPLNEDEVAATLAHELAHVLRKHGVQTDCLKRDYANDAPGLGLALTRQSHEQELEADRDASALMVRAGFRPQGLRSLLERLARENSSATYTHPAARERLKALGPRT